MTSIHASSAKLQGLVKSLNRADSKNLDSLIDEILHVLTCIPPLNLDQADHCAVHPQIEQCAVSLWNFAVVKKTDGFLSPKMNAQVRHVATNLVVLCNTGSCDEVTLRKEVVMAMKTARAWMDAKEFSMAENPITLASECIQKCKQISDMAADSEVKKMQLLELDKDLLKVLSYKAEMACHSGQNDVAMSVMLQAKEMLPTFPEETNYIAMLCYNFGLSCYNGKDYETGVKWLRESFDIGKTGTVSAKNQARTLRLLANVYLEWDSMQYCQQALNAIGLANAEHSHPAGLFLKLRILLEANSSEDRLKSGLDGILKHPEITVQLALSAIKLIFQHDRRELGYDSLQHLSAVIQKASDKNMIALVHLELLIDGKQAERAKQLVEDIITDHNTDSALEASTLTQLHAILWEQAVQYLDNKEYEEALQWYNYSLSLFPPSNQLDPNRARLHRNRASCLIGLKQCEKADDVLKEATKYDPMCIHTEFLQYKVALMLNREKTAIDLLHKICEGFSKQDGPQKSTIDAHGVICLAAQFAFEQNNRSVSVAALESLVRLSPDTQQVLIALRCLARVQLTLLAEAPKQNSRSHITSIHSYIIKALEKLTNLCTNGKLLESNLQTEAQWFMKIAWNMALQSEGNNEDLHELFILCYKLTELCPHNQGTLVRAKTCLLMASAASLQVAREQKLEEGKTKAYLATLEHVEGCRKICQQLEEHYQSTHDKLDSTTAVLLILYEFEARASMGDKGTETILERALAIPHCDHKVFETISALAMNPALMNRQLATRALKIAIRKHLESNIVDYDRCSKAFHSLIDLSLQSRSVTDMADKEQTWIYFTDVLQLIENKAKDRYPEIEILWLMTKAWNCGIHLYSTSHNGSAVRWCELAMKFLKYLGSTKDNYQAQMTTVYGEILAKMDPQQMQVDP